MANIQDNNNKEYQDPNILRLSPNHLQQILNGEDDVSSSSL